MAPHSSTLAWKIPWTEEPGGLQSMGLLGVGHDWATSLSRIGEGKGNPLQCSCLENPRDGGAWWAAVYGVTQSRARLKWLSSSSSSSTRSTFSKRQEHISPNKIQELKVERKNLLASVSYIIPRCRYSKIFFGMNGWSSSNKLLIY